MKCPKCGAEGVKAHITVNLYIDADDNYHLTKSVVRKKSTEIVAQSHDLTSYICWSCCNAWGYGFDSPKPTMTNQGE